MRFFFLVFFVCVIVDVWIGVKKTGLDFMWVSNFNIGPQSLLYYQWAPLEPYEDDGAVELWQTNNFMWNDVHENSTNYFVCRKVRSSHDNLNDGKSFPSSSPGLSMV